LEKPIMGKLPPIPPSWKNQSAALPLEAPLSGPDLDSKSKGILDGWQAPDWSLERSGLSLLLHPETIAQIDFGQGAPQSMAEQIGGYGTTGNMTTGNRATGTLPAQAQAAGHDNYNSAVFMTLPKTPLSPAVFEGKRNSTTLRDGLVLDTNNGDAVTDRVPAKPTNSELKHSGSHRVKSI
jgi:hypothetical protein